MSIIRVGTRTSALARTQAEATAQAIVNSSPELDGYEIVGVTTKGDVDRSPLAQIGGTGLFTSAVRQAVLDGDCDIAIHSAKDLPAADHPELAIFYPARVDPADVLCAHVPFAELPRGAKIGTGSPRREAQLRAARPDLEIVPIRGNVPTRLARINDDLDGVILARAGLARLGFDVGENLDPTIIIPAAAQGALGIETVRGSRWERVLEQVEDASTRLAVTAERAFMTQIGAGCTTPVGVIGRVNEQEIELHARYVDETKDVDHRLTGRDPLALARKLGAIFREAGVGLE